MTKTESLPLSRKGRSQSTWGHPADGSTAPTWDEQLSEDAFARDAATWRAADRNDLIALAAWGLPLLAAALAAIFL